MDISNDVILVISVLSILISAAALYQVMSKRENDSEFDDGDSLSSKYDELEKKYKENKTEILDIKLMLKSLQGTISTNNQGARNLTIDNGTPNSNKQQQRPNEMSPVGVQQNPNGVQHTNDVRPSGVQQNLNGVQHGVRPSGVQQNPCGVQHTNDVRSSGAQQNPNEALSGIQQRPNEVQQNASLPKEKEIPVIIKEQWLKVVDGGILAVVESKESAYYRTWTESNGYMYFEFNSSKVKKAINNRTSLIEPFCEIQKSNVEPDSASGITIIKRGTLNNDYSVNSKVLIKYI